MFFIIGQLYFLDDGEEFTEKMVDKATISMT